MRTRKLVELLEGWSVQAHSKCTNTSTLKPPGRIASLGISIATAEYSALQPPSPAGSQTQQKTEEAASRGQPAKGESHESFEPAAYDSLMSTAVRPEPSPLCQAKAQVTIDTAQHAVTIRSGKRSIRTGVARRTCKPHSMMSRPSMQSTAIQNPLLSPFLKRTHTYSCSCRHRQTRSTTICAYLFPTELCKIFRATC